ncbi:MAG TPA: aldo/keto reductase [Gemmatimonadaceae bacterium]|jgi:aryl-alcohol dehydrogenase-like predicted oxidoreductase
MITPAIPHRALGSQGLRVSAVGLGCMGFSEFYGDAASRAAVDGVAVIHHAIDHGVTLLDTADMYGPYLNEELVGRAVRGRREGVVIATKFGILRDPNEPSKRGVNGRPEYVRASCEGSLRRLGVETIDLYYQHRRDKTIPIEETVGAMAQLVHEGKVRFIGLSEVSAETLRRAHATHPITAVQSEWSLWTRDWERTTFAAARALGVGLVPYSPLGRGFLTGAITADTSFPEGDYRHTSPRFVGENRAANLRIVEAVKAVAASKGCTPAQVALAWILARGEDVVPIPGTTKAARIDENLGACAVGLSAADLATLADSLPAAAGDRYPTGMQALVDE